MAKVVNTGSPKFAAGGPPGKFNPQATASAGAAKKGSTVMHEGSGSAKFADGGGPGAYNPQSTASAGPAKAGSSVGRSGDGGNFASGGSHSMMSNRGSVPARPGKSSAY